MCFRPPTTNEIKCPECGKPIPFGFDECAVCGAKVSGAPGAGTPAPPASPAAPAAPAAPGAPKAPGAPR